MFGAARCVLLGCFVAIAIGHHNAVALGPGGSAVIHEAICGALPLPKRVFVINLSPDPEDSATAFDGAHQLGWNWVGLTNDPNMGTWRNACRSLDIYFTFNKWSSAWIIGSLNDGEMVKFICWRLTEILDGHSRFEKVFSLTQHSASRENVSPQFLLGSFAGDLISLFGFSDSVVGGDDGLVVGARRSDGHPCGDDRGAESEHEGRETEDAEHNLRPVEGHRISLLAQVGLVVICGIGAIWITPIGLLLFAFGDAWPFAQDYG